MKRWRSWCTCRFRTSGSKARRCWSASKGQSLTIPISGTLRQPQMDQSAIAGLSQQLLQGAAQQAIGGELNKALDKFFKPR